MTSKPQITGELWPDMSKDVEIDCLKVLLCRALFALEHASVSMTYAEEYQRIIDDLHQWLNQEGDGNV